MDWKTVMPICLPPFNAITRGGYRSTGCIVSGWGSTGEGSDVSDALLKAVVPLINDQQCRMDYSDRNRKVTSQMLCAGFPRGGKDACQADSEGPLACLWRNNQYCLAGVVSWGDGCGRPNSPGVYTEVVHFVGWIQSVTGPGVTQSVTV